MAFEFMVTTISAISYVPRFSGEVLGGRVVASNATPIVAMQIYIRK